MQSVAIVNEPLPILVENALRIAWDYLEQLGQIDDPELTRCLLLTRWSI
jgi:hypothetical protein